MKIKIKLGDGTEWTKEYASDEEAEKGIEEFKVLIKETMGDQVKSFTVLKDVSRKMG